MLNKAKIYIAFLLYKFANGLLFSLSIFFFVDDKSVVSLISIMIIQEFYFSYFYTAKKNQSIERNSSFPVWLFLLSSCLVFFLFYLYSEERVSVYIYLIMAFNLIMFSIYAWHAPLNEKNDVTRWVSLENKFSLLSVLIISISLFVSYFFKYKVDVIILMRLGLVYFAMNIFYFCVLKNNINSINRGAEFFRSLDIVLLLLVAKLFYFEISVSNGGMDGYSIKIFLIFYDVLAALIGLYIRRVIALTSANFSSFNLATLYVNSFLLISLLISVLFLDINNEIFNTITSTLVFVSLAVNYNYFNFKNHKKSWILKVVYLLVFIIAYTLSSTSTFIFIILINFIYSLFYRLKKVER